MGWRGSIVMSNGYAKTVNIFNMPDIWSIFAA
jgi:hypothetical protein